MDSFAVLRHRLYRRYLDPVEREEALVAGLAGLDAMRSGPLADLVALRRLIRYPEASALSELEPRKGRNPYFDRYFSDAISALQNGAKIPVELFSNKRSREDKSFPITQTIFRGDPTKPGRGDGGGIGSLALRIGGALGARGVATLTVIPTFGGGSPSKESEKKPISHGHDLVRLPVDVGGASTVDLLNGRPKIADTFRKFIADGRIAPSLVHVRFFDDASLAVARVSREYGIPVALTMAPDPHRTLCDNQGEIRTRTSDAWFDILNRIWIGDELITIARGLMAIGRRAVEESLLDYFPQLENTRDCVVAAVNEGVPTGPTEGDKEPDIPGLLTDTRLTRRLSKRRIGFPTFLCVGRLAPVKNQPALTAAWASGFSRDFNLVFVGGDLENPTTTEEKILRGIDAALDTVSREDLEGFAHLPGQTPEMVRAIELWYARRRLAADTDIYIAPSAKEEFGLAILEAMGAGMIACAPISGGAGEYLRSGVNGFLIDTRNGRTIEKELITIVESLRRRPSRREAIRRNAARTVSDGYSVEKMVDGYEDFYARIAREEGGPER